MRCVLVAVLVTLSWGAKRRRAKAPPGDAAPPPPPVSGGAGKEEGAEPLIKEGAEPIIKPSAAENDSTEGDEDQPEVDETPFSRKKQGDEALLKKLAARHTALNEAAGKNQWEVVGKMFARNARFLSYKTNGTQGRDEIVNFYKKVKKFVEEGPTDEYVETEGTFVSTDALKAEKKKQDDEKAKEKARREKLGHNKVTLRFEILSAAKIGRAIWARGDYVFEAPYSHEDPTQELTPEDGKTEDATPEAPEKTEAAKEAKVDVGSHSSQGLYNVDAGRFVEWYTVRSNGAYQATELVLHSDYGAFEEPPKPYIEEQDWDGGIQEGPYGDMDHAGENLDDNTSDQGPQDFSDQEAADVHEHSEGLPEDEDDHTGDYGEPTTVGKDDTPVTGAPPAGQEFDDELPADLQTNV